MNYLFVDCDWRGWIVIIIRIIECILIRIWLVFRIFFIVGGDWWVGLKGFGEYWKGVYGSDLVY